MDRSDEELLSATPDDVEAFATFYRRHEHAVLAFFHRRTHDPEMTADLTAETFAAALLAAPRFRPGPTPARAWLFGIANNKLLQSLDRGRVDRGARRRLSMEPLVLEDETLRRIERIGTDARVSALLNDLPAAQAEAVRGRIIDERAYDELAKTLRTSESVVRKRVSRGLATLKRRIGERP